MAPQAQEHPGAEGEEKVAFLQKAYRELAKLWDPGDGERFPGVYQELDRIEGSADALSLDDLKERLRSLYVEYRKDKEGT